MPLLLRLRSEALTGCRLACLFQKDSECRAPWEQPATAATAERRVARWLAPRLMGNFQITIIIRASQTTDDSSLCDSTWATSRAGWSCRHRRSVRGSARQYQAAKSARNANAANSSNKSKPTFGPPVGFSLDSLALGGSKRREGRDSGSLR